MRQNSVYWWLVLLLGFLLSASSVYINKKNKKNLFHQKSNHIHHVKRYGSAFKNDQDVRRYLKIFGVPMMLWRCRNAIQPYYTVDSKPIPVVELYCETIGKVKAISWYHNGKRIAVGGRYGEQFMPHYANGHWFSWWLDFTLRIYNATHEDTGVYAFQVRGPKKVKQQQYIYVDISQEQKRRKREELPEDHPFNQEP